MAPNARQKKRPGTEQPATTSAKKARTAPPPASNNQAKRKRAIDPSDAEQQSPVELQSHVREPKSKKTKTTTTTSGVSTVRPGKSESLTKSAQNVNKRTEGKDEEDEWASGDSENIKDHSAALLEGFDSSSDEGEGEDAIAELPDIPKTKVLSKKLEAASKNESEGGVVYVGRIPHGFYEHQMKAYFSQFGDITRLRLSRNKKTGNSKHYAFIEFASREVAKIVAATMNKYLLFGHILQVRLMAPEEIHKDLFKGANKRFKAIPRNKIQGRHLRLPKEREVWEKRIANETKRRKEKEEKLKLLGYGFKGPELVSTSAIPFREPTTKAIASKDEASQPEAEPVLAPKPKEVKSKIKATRAKPSVKV